MVVTSQVVITSNQESKYMNIQLSQEEIVKAIQQYVSGQGILTQGKKISVDFTATRKGGQQILAKLVIVDADESFDNITVTTNTDAVDVKETKEDKPVAEAVVAAPVTEGTTEVAADPASVQEPVTQEVISEAVTAVGAAPVVTEEKPKTTSLFG